MNLIFSNSKVNNILDEYTCALGLDISKNSTGVCLYQNGIMSLYKIHIESKYDISNSLWEAEMKKEFKGYLTKLVKDKEFDLVVVENTINGVNAVTNKELTILNTVFDDLVIEGVCKVKKENLIRPTAVMWRKILKELAVNISASNVKELTEKLLLRLGYKFVIEHQDDTDKYKKDIGYYDICDATGMLISYMYKKSSLYSKSEVVIEQNK